MGNAIIVPLYQKVYNEKFEYDTFAKRMKMQKCIYLAEQYGLNVGGYDFSWYKHGPYSQRLQDDMFIESRHSFPELQYSEYALHVIARLTKMVNMAKQEGFFYSEDQWMECLASIHYLNRLYKSSEQESLAELQRRKPHLCNSELNKLAYDLAVDNS